MARRSAPNKQQIVSEIRSLIERELAGLVQAAKAAHEAATHEESKSEDKHDTRATEASYLAGAQAQRVSELQQALIYFKQLEPKEFAENDAIGVSALIELDSSGKKQTYLIAQHGGGIKVSIAGKEIQVITPHSPIGEELIGRRAGDTFEISREYEILSVV